MNLIDKFQKNQEIYILRDGFSLRTADKAEYGIHETIYSNMDTELNFSWKKQTENKLSSDNLFWIFKDDRRIGGVHIEPGVCGPFFMEAPHDIERNIIINILNDVLLEWSEVDKNPRLYGVIPSDVEHFSKLGYQIKSERKVMICPTESFEALKWQDKYIVKVPTISDAAELGQLFFDSYSGSLQYEVFGQETVEEAKVSAERMLTIYESNNTLEGSTLVYDRNTNKLIAACIAGISGYCDNNFSELGDLVVLPEYRKLGLGANLIKQMLNNLKDISPATILCVIVGNPAESLYNKMGFFSGISFTNMYLNK